MFIFPAILLVGTTLAQLQIGTVCDLDSQCQSFCCSNDYNADQPGKCTEIASDPRCKQRATNDKIALVIILILMAASVAYCAYVKKKQVAAKKAETQQRIEWALK